MPLEDELGDILEKARDGKGFSQKDLAHASGVDAGVIRRIENYKKEPDEDAVFKLANALDLHAPSLLAIAEDKWQPEPTAIDPAAFELVCLNVFMGSYPVKCYLLICKETRDTAIVDTGANPRALIDKAKELGVVPTKILLTHNHPDHAGGLGVLDKEFSCPAYIDPKEPKPWGSRDLRLLKDGQRIPLGKLEVEVMATPGHTPGGVSFKIGESVLSGDAIFAGSMGRANASWPGLYESITTRLLTLPEQFRLHPGHGPATTVGEEKRHNPFFFGKVPA